MNSEIKKKEIKISSGCTRFYINSNGCGFCPLHQRPVGLMLNFTHVINNDLRFTIDHELKIILINNFYEKPDFDNRCVSLFSSLTKLRFNNKVCVLFLRTTRKRDE